MNVEHVSSNLYNLPDSCFGSLCVTEPQRSDDTEKRHSVAASWSCEPPDDAARYLERTLQIWGIALKKKYSVASDSNAFYSPNAARINTFDVIHTRLAGFLDSKAERFFEAEVIVFIWDRTGEKTCNEYELNKRVRLIIFLQNWSNAHQWWIWRFYRGVAEVSGMVQSNYPNLDWCLMQLTAAGERSGCSEGHKKIFNRGITDKITYKGSNWCMWLCW